MASRLKTYLMRSEEPLPPMADVDEAVREILQLYQANSGATFSLYFGSLVGERLYAVSVYPERTYRTRTETISPEVLKAYIEANHDLLNDPRCCVGIWRSEETGFTYLDISIALPNKRQVIQLGRRCGQEGVFDLFRMEYLPTGGMGEPPEDLPPIRERLPALERGKRKR